MNIKASEVHSKFLLNHYAINAKVHTVVCEEGSALPQNSGFVPMVDKAIEHNGASYRCIVREFVEAKRLSGFIGEGELYTKRGDLDRMGMYSRYADAEIDKYKTRLRYAAKRMIRPQCIFNGLSMH